MGFTQTTSDPCLYVSSEGEMFIIAVYVDDILLAGKSIERISEVKEEIAKRFKVKDMGELHHFLGVKVIQNPKAETIWMGQPMYIESTLKKFKMENVKATKLLSTPV